MHGCLSVVGVECYQVERSLQRADHSSGRVLPTVMCRCVLSRNLLNEETLAHWGGGAVAPKTNKINASDKLATMHS